MRKRSHEYQLLSHSCTYCVRITGLHALRRSRNNSVTNPRVRIVLEGCGAAGIARDRRHAMWCAPRCDKISPRWGIKLSRIGVPRREEFLIDARWCRAIWSVNAVRLCQVAWCAHAASNIHCATSLRRVRVVLRNLMASIVLLRLLSV